MSYDVWLEIDTGGDEAAAIDTGWNYTSNCARMWRKAGADLAEFHGKVAGDVATTLRSAIARMERNPDEYISLNPENGWGSYDTVVPALRRLLHQFEEHPKATVRVWR